MVQKGSMKAVTFAEFIQTHYLPVSTKRSVNKDIRMLESKILPAFGALPLAEIETKTLVTFHGIY